MTRCHKKDDEQGRGCVRPPGHRGRCKIRDIDDPHFDPPDGDAEDLEVTAIAQALRSRPAASRLEPAASVDPLALVTEFATRIGLPRPVTIEGDMLLYVSPINGKALAVTRGGRLRSAAISLAHEGAPG